MAAPSIVWITELWFGSITDLLQFVCGSAICCLDHRTVGWKYNTNGLTAMCALCVAAAEIAAELEQDDRSEKGGEVGATVKHRELSLIHI